MHWYLVIRNAPKFPSFSADVTTTHSVGHNIF
jgi:hypothetical protein